MQELAELSTIEDTARYLGMSPGELRRVIDQGQLRVIPPSPEILIHEADLADYLNQTRTVHVRRRLGFRLPKILSRSSGK